MSIEMNVARVEAESDVAVRAARIVLARLAKIVLLVLWIVQYIFALLAIILRPEDDFSLSVRVWGFILTMVCALLAIGIYADAEQRR